eukprot:1436515-Rhodomonas_salina.2
MGHGSHSQAGTGTRHSLTGPPARVTFTPGRGIQLHVIPSVDRPRQPEAAEAGARGPGRDGHTVTGGETWGVTVAGEQVTVWCCPVVRGD